MKRATGLLLACAAATLGSGVVTGMALAADTTVEAGWWTSTNPGSVEGTPTPPPPPDVPAGGLLVEGGPQSTTGKANAAPTAFAAAVFQIPPGTTARRLTLSVAPNSATTPTSQLELCALTNPALPVESGGPMADAPTYTCAKNVSADPSSDGGRYTFNVASLVTDDALAVAILPTSPVDRVVLSAPKGSSVEVQLSPQSSTPRNASGGGLGTTGSSPGTSTDAGSASSPSGTAPTIPGPPPPASPSTSGAVPEQQTPQVASPQTAYQPTGITAASELTPSRAKPHTVIVLLAVLALGVVFWQMVGRAAVEAALRN